MDRIDEKKYTLDEYSWHLLNNLEQFNDKPDLIRSLYETITAYLPEHTILNKFYDYYKTALKYYEDHSSFPDIHWFEVNYAKSGKFKRTDNEFSIQVYEDYVKKIDLEIIKRDCKNLVSEIEPEQSSIRNIINKMTKYCDSTEKLPVTTKGSIINMYDDYCKTYTGINTGIEDLDNVIGKLGHKSLCVFGAPSGHGKSTFAITTTYNMAVKLGRCVDYISYEVPKEHIWYNLVAIHSRHFLPDGRALEASRMKEQILDDREKEEYRRTAEDLLRCIKESGGFIDVLDQTTAHADTFEALCARMEGRALERVDGENRFARKADLIIVDNVDNFQILRSNERDEMVRVNNYIVSLDSFCKKYHNGEGCTILLLTQVNRSGMRTLNKEEGSQQSEETKASNVDVTVFQRYNALYEKATVCLVGYASPAMRLSGNMNVYPVKLRNRPVPERPVRLNVDFKHSFVGETEYDLTETTRRSEEERNDIYDKMSTYASQNGISFDEEEMN